MLARNLAIFQQMASAGMLDLDVAQTAPPV